MIEKLILDNFTAFARLEVEFSKGINVFIGENGTGKTHILKVVYCACDITKSKKNFAGKLTEAFLPWNRQTGRLVKRGKGGNSGYVEVHRHLADTGESISLKLSLTRNSKKPSDAAISGAYEKWAGSPFESAYISVKDMLANSRGFSSLYNQRYIQFEEVYADIITRALLPPLKGPMDGQRKKLLTVLQRLLEGKVIIDNEDFFLKTKKGTFEFTLLAEGLRKLALLSVLIENGVLIKGAVLCWDEPETNLNPHLMKTVVEILIELQRMGIQVFVSTHDFMILKYFDLLTTSKDDILYHSLYFQDSQNREINLFSTAEYLNISPNAIDDTFGDIANREIQRSMEKIPRLKVTAK